LNLIGINRQRKMKAPQTKTVITSATLFHFVVLLLVEELLKRLRKRRRGGEEKEEEGGREVNNFRCFSFRLVSLSIDADFFLPVRRFLRCVSS